jgi:adenylosuccinate lyase
MHRILSGLHVYPERMRRNLSLSGGLMLSEAVMLALAEKVGRQTAHEIVYQCAMSVVEQRRPFAEALASHAVVAQHLAPSEIERLLEPERYLGLAQEFTDRVRDEASVTA